MAATYSISGLASGLDWRSMISQLVELERRPITLLEEKQTTLGEKKSAWNQVNSLLRSLKTAAGALNSPDDFNLFTPKATINSTTLNVSDLLSYAVGSNATEGSYNITVNNLAAAQKLSSKSFGSTSEALGISGELIINNRVLSIAATDSLSTIQNKINALNSGENPAGVTASIIAISTGEYRLSLTSRATGSEGISLASGSADNILTQLGLADGTLSLRNAVTGGARSWAFSSSADSIGQVFGLTGAASGTVTIAGVAVSIDLSTDSLEDIAGTINNNAALQAAGVHASVVQSKNGDETVYTLQIDGTQDFTDSSNILQTLGILKQGYSDVTGVNGTMENTVNGAAISSSTLLIDIDGYNTWTPGDSITIQGTGHDGTALDASVFSITESSTVGDLLSAVEAAFGGEVTAYVNGSGAIVVEDNQAGASSLSLTLTPSIAAANSSLNFGSFESSTIRKREIVAGQDAEITLDGITFTRSTNQISDVIAGITLDLIGADENATITLNVVRDYEGVKGKIKELVDSYNKVMSYIAAQNEAPGEGNATKPLYADTSLYTVKSTLRSIILSGVTGLDSGLDHLSLIGINIDKTGQLSINNAKLDGYLQSNFEDVVNLFSAQGTSMNSSLTYITSGINMAEGDYEVEITQTATRASAVGSGFSGVLSEDATLTLTNARGKEETITLSAGLNIASIVNAINSGNTLGIVAENDGGQLRISSSTYGSSGEFTLSMTGGNLGLADGTYTGLDVAGRIREQGSSDWMSMTGRGQTLIGDDDQAVEGLWLRYTGSETGMVDFSFIKGVGDRLDKALHYMSDGIDGYVANKQKSLQNQINNIDKKIDRMEMRLTQYQETLIAKYTAMERLLSQLQSQQSWLMNQISFMSGV
ncbi:MAG: flagellar filament capping protein FliD [Desulfomonilia bacterium]|jgi:flagellar hook-associated protein 2|uniref:Filament cap protein n=1 Tax=anaerobic digester metagenome TaxID=1263854 RepID=A0A485M638_9ZZZZ